MKILIGIVIGVLLTVLGLYLYVWQSTSSIRSELEREAVEDELEDVVIGPLVVIGPEDKPLGDPIILRSAGEYRIVISRVCQGVNCSTGAYLEVLTGSYPRKVKQRTVIPSDTGWENVDVTAIVADQADNETSFIVRGTKRTNSGTEEFTLRVVPSELLSSYRVKKMKKID